MILLTWVHAGLGYFAWSVGKKTIVDSYLPWYLEYPTDVALTAFAVHPRTAGLAHAGAIRTGQYMHWVGRVAWGSRAGLAARAGVASASATAAVFASATVLGYAVGATVGTGISQVAFGDEGAEDAIDFYSGNVSWDEYWTTVSSAF